MNAARTMVDNDDDVALRFLLAVDMMMMMWLLLFFTEPYFLNLSLFKGR